LKLCCFTEKRYEDALDVTIRKQAVDKGFQHGGRVVYITEAVPPYFGIYSKPGFTK
jgi:hypothetical protein